MTSAVTGQRSNQLSYWARIFVHDKGITPASGSLLTTTSDKESPPPPPPPPHPHPSPPLSSPFSPLSQKRPTRARAGPRGPGRQGGPLNPPGVQTPKGWEVLFLLQKIKVNNRGTEPGPAREKGGCSQLPCQGDILL